MALFRKKREISSDLKQYDKVVVLIGGAGYVGKVLLNECASFTKILFVNVSPKSTFSSHNVISLRADMTKDSVKTFIKILSITDRIDVLVHMAAVYAFDTAEFLSITNVRREFEINTFIPLFSTQELCRNYWNTFSQEENKKLKRKVIVIGSQAGGGKTKRKELIIYSATKAALSVAWEYYADFLNSKGIESIFLKPGGLREKKELNDFVQVLKGVIIS